MEVIGSFREEPRSNEILEVEGQDLSQPGHNESVSGLQEQEQIMNVEKLDIEGPSVKEERPAAEIWTDQVLNTVFESERLKDEDINFRKEIITELESVLSNQFPGIQLKPYGSFVNGFGSTASDLDLCTFFENENVLKSGSKKDLTEVLGKMVNLIKASGKFRRAILIRARVPIVRFWYKQKNFEGDISLENKLSLVNTQLLRTYTNIDERVKILGLFLKTVMKMCDLNDASVGGLSSYGFSVLLIHYLQRVQPPVLPVLQEICTESDEALVAGNEHTRFFRDLTNLGKVWPALGQNKMKPSELWFGFLNYYLNFNFEEQIVTIRQSVPAMRIIRVHKDKKELNKGDFEIQDPFDTTGQSVGKNVSKYTSDHILKIFRYMVDANYSVMLENMKSSYARWKNGRQSSLFSRHPRGMPVKDNPPKKPGRSGSKKHWEMHRAHSKKMKEERLDRASKKRSSAEVAGHSKKTHRPGHSRPQQRKEVQFHSRRGRGVNRPQNNHYRNVSSVYFNAPLSHQRTNLPVVSQFDHRRLGNNFQRQGQRNSNRVGRYYN